MKSYETLVTRPYIARLADIKKAIDEINVLNRPGYYIQLDETTRLIRPEAENVPPFTVPFTHTDEFVYADARPFFGRGATVPNRNLFDYAGLKARAALTHMWEFEPKTLEAYTVPSSVVFGHWMANALASRFDADAVDRSIIQALSTIYYICLFYTEMEGKGVKSDELNMTLNRALGPRGAGLPQSSIDPLLADPDIVKLITSLGEAGSRFTLDNLAQLIAQKVSFQMGPFDAVTLHRLTAGGTWLGWEATTIALMALEYPPNLIFMIGQAAENSMYRNKTRIGGILNSHRRSINTDAFSRLIKSLEV